MPLPSIHRFYNEDYPGSPSWFQAFISALNLFSDPMYQTVNKGLTFQSNFNAQIYSFQIRGGATDADNVVTFTSNVKGRVSGLLTVACNLTSNIQAPASGIVTSWYQSNNQIFITNITGLTPGTNYNMTVLIF